MSTRPRPRLVGKPAPRLREVTLVDAAAHFPASPSLQKRWLAAVAWLRRGEGPGWLLDAGSRPMFRSHVE